MFPLSQMGLFINLGKYTISLAHFVPLSPHCSTSHIPIFPDLAQIPPSSVKSSWILPAHGGLFFVLVAQNPEKDVNI